MTAPVQWNEHAMPLGIGLDQLLYQVRRTDDGLIYDSVTLEELTDGGDALALDALVTPYAKLDRKVRQLQMVMARAVQGLGVEAMQVSDPFKQNGTANVVALLELSDGQTVSIYFHNPDATPGKILPTDELISWKWLLNKKDITIVVAPERGSDLAIREVGRRIMKLAAKNSAAFARVNARRAERLQNIASLRGEVEGLERELDGVMREIEVARLEAEERELKAVEDSQQNSVEKGMGALNSVRQFLSRGQFKAIAEAMKGEEGRFFVDKAKVLAQLIEGMAKTYEQDGKGDDATAYLHYFKGSADWHITEKDASGKGTEQAFGLADLGQGGELGYISIDELVRNNVELDLHFEPKTLAALKPAEPETPAVSVDAQRLDAGKTMLESVATEFGGTVSPWEPTSEGTVGLWEYTNLSIGETALRVGVSGGGVVSINGSPHDPDGTVNDNAESVRKSIAAALPAQAEPLDPTSEEGYAMVLADEALQLAHQDRLDSFFQGRIIAVRNALRDMGWEGERFGDISKNGVVLKMHLQQVGAGKNLVGTDYSLAGVPGFFMSDTLARTPQEIAERIDKGLPKPAAEPEQPPSFSVGESVEWRNDNGTVAGTYRGLVNETTAVIMASGMQMNAPLAELYPAAVLPAPAPEEDPLMITPEGKANTVKTAKGNKVETGFTVIEADRLIASHDINGNPNPEYPQIIQPRDRGRDSSIAWVKKTASQLDPDSLGRTSRADSGAPIVGPDRVVESGNGRTMAIQEAYRAGTAEEYRDWLIEEAEYFGLDPERIRGMKAPVLVRVRTSSVDRRQFAVEANQDDKLTMTGTEKAKADADRLDMALLAKLGDDGNLLASTNREFVNGFLRSLGDTEAAQYMTSTGQPTGALIARIQAAIFAKAYNDDRLLELTADSSRPEVANVLEALNVSAPEFILAQAADAAGTQALTGQLVDSVATSLNQQAVEAIIQATNLVRKARSEGGSVEEAINQLGLFGDIPPATAAMALFISKNNRSAKRLGVAFKAMAEFVRSEAERGQTVDMFGDSSAATLQQIIEAANRKLEQEYGEGAYAIESLDLFAQPEPEAAVEQPQESMNYVQWQEALVLQVQERLSVSRDEAQQIVDMQRSIVAGFGSREDQAPERTPAEVAAEMIEKLTAFPGAADGWILQRSVERNRATYKHATGGVEIDMWAIGSSAQPVDFYKYKIIKGGTFHSEGRVAGVEAPQDAQSMEAVFAQAEALVAADQPEPATPEAQPDPTMQPVPEPAKQESTAMTEDREFLESILNNTVPDILAPELGDQIGAVYERNADDAHMLSLIEQAVMAYQRAMEQATASL